jgi:hypothetical protein
MFAKTPHIFRVEKGPPIPKTLPEKLLCEYSHSSFLSPPINTNATASRFMSFPFRLDESAPILKYAGASAPESGFRRCTVQA